MKKVKRQIVLCFVQKDTNTLENINTQLKVVLNCFFRKEAESTKIIFDAVFKPNAKYTEKEVLEVLQTGGPGFFSFSFSLGELLLACLPCLHAVFEVSTHIDSWQRLTKLLLV